jgi:hypothetical protein
MHSMRSLYSPRDCLQLCLLAPSLSHLPDGFANVRQQADVYDRLLTDAQRLRGRIYQAEGAISAEAMDAWDRYVCPQDTDAWHILLRDGCGHVRGAMRITFFRTAATVPIERLHAFDLVQRAPDPVRQEYSDALQSFLNDALLEKPFFFEAGGLVLDTEVRNSRRSTVLTAANWSLCRALAGARGVGAATQRHGSAGILRRFGGFDLPTRSGGVLLPFFDSCYQCEMKVLGFCSDRLHPCLEETVTDIQDAFATMPIYCR